MASGDLYKAITRTGGLSPIVDMFKQVADAKRKKDVYDQVMSLYNQKNSAMDSYNNQNLQQNNAQATTPQPNQLGDSLSSLINQQQPGEITPNDNMSIDALTTQSRNNNANVMSPKDIYNNANKDYRDFIAGSLTQDADPQLVNTLAQLLGQRVQSLKPSPIERITAKQGDDILAYDPESGSFNKIYSNEKDTTPKEVLLDSIWDDKVNKKVDLYGYLNGDKEIITRKQYSAKDDKSGNGKGSGSGEDSTYGDYSKQLGELNKGKAEIEAKIKEMYSNPVSEDNKQFYSVKNSYGDSMMLTPEEARAEIDKVKSKYIGTAISLINQQGLDDIVVKIRKALQEPKLQAIAPYKADSITKTNKTPLETIMKNLAELPDTKLDKADMRILNDYFTLMEL